MPLLGKKFEQPKPAPTPENMPRPESAPENSPERGAERVVQKAESNLEPVIPATSPTQTVAPEPTYYEKRASLIDAYLAEGLEDTFLSMSPAEQQNFKRAGEETVSKINTLLDAAKVNVSKIVSLIKKWLSLIVGVNRFYLDQEAKIKADKIINLKNKL